MVICFTGSLTSLLSLAVSKNLVANGAKAQVGSLKAISKLLNKCKKYLSNLSHHQQHHQQNDSHHFRYPSAKRRFRNLLRKHHLPVPAIVFLCTCLLATSTYQTLRVRRVKRFVESCGIGCHKVLQTYHATWNWVHWKMTCHFGNHLFFRIPWLCLARWAPTTYKWGYNPYKWHYKWVTVVITPISGGMTLLITGSGPPCRGYETKTFLRVQWLKFTVGESLWNLWICWKVGNVSRLLTPLNSWNCR